MALWLFLLFTVVPALELYLLIQIGKVIGSAETVLFLVAMGILGAWLAKREGLSVLRKVQQDTLNGIPPTDRLVEGVLVVVGAVLLITPGVLTDVVGFVLIVPFTRRLLIPLVKRAAAKQLLSRGVVLGPAEPGPAAREARRQRADRAVDEQGHGTPGGSGAGGGGEGFDHPVR